MNSILRPEMTRRDPLAFNKPHQKNSWKGGMDGCSHGQSFMKPFTKLVHVVCVARLLLGVLILFSTAIAAPAPQPEKVKGVWPPVIQENKGPVEKAKPLPPSKPADLSLKIDPKREAAWKVAKAQAEALVTEFDVAVKTGDTLKIRTAALKLQADPMGIVVLNAQENDGLILEHKASIEKIKTNAKENIKKNMVEAWNTTHPLTRDHITEDDVEIYEPTNLPKPEKDGDASTSVNKEKEKKKNRPKSGQDWDVTVLVRPKPPEGSPDDLVMEFEEIHPSESKSLVEKSYYDGAGGEQVFGKLKPGETVEQAAARAAEHQFVETTSSKSNVAYSDADILMGNKLKNLQARPEADIGDAEQVSQAMDYKSNTAREKAEDAARKKKADLVETARQEVEQMRQAWKQCDKITKPRLEAAGLALNEKLEQGMKIFEKVKDAEISPEEARVELAKLGHTPESMINKLAGQVEALQTLKPPGYTPKKSGKTDTPPKPDDATATVETPEKPKAPDAPETADVTESTEGNPAAPEGEPTVKNMPGKTDLDLAPGSSADTADTKPAPPPNADGATDSKAPTKTTSAADPDSGDPKKPPPPSRPSQQPRSQARPRTSPAQRVRTTSQGRRSQPRRERRLPRKPSQKFTPITSGKSWRKRSRPQFRILSPRACCLRRCSRKRVRMGCMRC
jgi:hypothetical protein